MALIRVGYAIPDEGIVAFTCERSKRRAVYTRINLAYAMGGMRAVRSYLASSDAGTSNTQDREN